VTLVFTPPYRAFRGPVGRDTPKEDWKPWIWFTPTIPFGNNVWVLWDGTVQEKQPPFLDDAQWVFYAGHITPVSAVQIAVLTAAGYGAYIVDDSVVTPPVVIVPPSSGDPGTFGDGAFGDGKFGQ
jgi:hypothetical protein